MIQYLIHVRKLFYLVHHLHSRVQMVTVKKSKVKSFSAEEGIYFSWSVVVLVVAGGEKGGKSPIKGDFDQKISSVQKG